MGSLSVVITRGESARIVQDNALSGFVKLIIKMLKKLETLKAELEKMYAVELLEYYDKNHLSGDNKTRSETRQEQLQYSIRLINEINETAQKVVN